MKTYTKKIINNILGGIISAIIVLCFLLSLVNFSFSLLYIKTSVQGYSMLPTINSTVPSPYIDGDTILVNSYQPLNRDDIVIANLNKHEVRIIKRLIALPGDTIEVTETAENYCILVNSEVKYSKPKDELINNESIDEIMLDYEFFITDPKNTNNVVTENGHTYIKLNEDEYFLVGDNWADSTDSFSFGPLNKKDIIGKVELLIPFNTNANLEIFKFIYKKLFTI